MEEKILNIAKSNDSVSSRRFLLRAEECSFFAMGLAAVDVGGVDRAPFSQIGLYTAI